MTPDIAEIEKVPAGVLVTFADGRSAVYSPALLYDLLPEAQQVPPGSVPDSSPKTSTISALTIQKSR
jgi:hypothetical protein